MRERERGVRQDLHQGRDLKKKLLLPTMAWETSTWFLSHPIRALSRVALDVVDPVVLEHPDAVLLWSGVED